jgi:colicin import membrane protein
VKSPTGRTTTITAPASTFVAAPSRTMATAAANRICIGRVCGPAMKEEGRAIRYAEARCAAACAEGSDLCKKCMGYETKYMAGEGPLKFHGRMGQANLPAESHIFGSAWNVAARAKEDARAAKAVVKVAEAAAGGAGAAAAAPVVKKAKAAAKRAETAANATMVAAEDAGTEFAHALAAAANAAAGIAPVADVAPKVRKAAAKTKKVVASATLTREQALVASKQVTELMALMRGQTAQAKALRAALRTHAGVSNRSSSSSGRSTRRRRSGSGSGSVIYRRASASPVRATRRANSRGASPSERTTSERVKVQDKILAELMAAGGAGAAPELE